MGGKACIAGHRIRVSDIVRNRDRLGYTPAQIVKALPTIDLAQVRAALKYYEEHKAEIDAEIAKEDAIAAEWRAEQASTWTKTSTSN
jgi:uncharacterized protein (DUF433 family)